MASWIYLQLDLYMGQAVVVTYGTNLCTLRSSSKDRNFNLSTWYLSLVHGFVYLYQQNCPCFTGDDVVGSESALLTGWDLLHLKSPVISRH